MKQTDDPLTDDVKQTDDPLTDDVKHVKHVKQTDDPPNAALERFVCTISSEFKHKNIQT